MTTPFNKTSSESDKIQHHGYHRFYPRYLDQFQNKSIQMLEIGIDQEESMKLWIEYLPQAHIHGIDIKPYESSDRITMHQIDQSDSSQLDAFEAKYKNHFEFIIDDGSHVPAHQILTLSRLWNCLKEGGIYIIEDVETNYWGKSEIYGYQFDSKSPNLYDYLKAAPHHINAEFNSKSAIRHGVFDELETISFGHNCIILEKKRASNIRFYDRSYRFSHLQNFRSLKVRMSKAIKLLAKGHPRGCWRSLIDPKP